MTKLKGVPIASLMTPGFLKKSMVFALAASFRQPWRSSYTNATSSEIGKAVGVSKQRAHELLILVRGAFIELTGQPFP